MEYEQVRYQPGRVARVILNRPKYRNAQSRRLLEEMGDAFDKAMADDEVRVIVLSGEGAHFSSGHDLGSPEELADRRQRGYPTDPRGQYKRMQRIILTETLRWRNLEKPTIAMVHGYCIYGGWMIASAMDVVFASEDALFLPSLLQYFSVPWDIGARKAKEVLFEHRFMTAAEALRYHFVNQVCPREKLEEQTLAYANRVAENDTFRVGLIKYAINHMLDTMGFSSEMETAYRTYALRNLLQPTEPGHGGEPGIARVSTALENLQVSLARPEPRA